MNTSKTTRVIATSLVLVAFAVFWRLVGPRQLGGTASYVITHGNSMEPEYHEGDLVILKAAGAYTKGDIVGFQSASLGRTVLHRIHDFEGDAFITKGDNNAWLDTDRPTDADVIGKAWLDVPGAGTWLARVRSPFVVITLLGAVAVTFLFGNRKRKRGTGERGIRMPGRRELSALGRPTGAVWVAGGLALLFGLAAVAAFRQPLADSIATGRELKHVGQFSYSAEVERSPVYPSGEVEAGQGVFLRLVDRVQVGFDYSLRSDASAAVSGTAKLVANVTGATGWQRSLTLAPPKAIRDGEVRLEGVIDIGHIQRLSRRVQAITALPEAAQDIEVVARVTLEGAIAGDEIAEQFTPSLALRMDTVQLQLMANDDVPATTQNAGELLMQTGSTELETISTRPNELHLFGSSIELIDARRTAIVVATLCLLIAVGLAVRTPVSAPDEIAAIQAKYGRWLIPVASIQAERVTKTVQVKNMDALVRLAEAYERMVMHDEADGIHAYFIEEDGVMYCYRPHSLQPEGAEEPRAEETAEIEPAPHKSESAFVARRSREERRRAEAERLRQEIAGIESGALQETAAPTTPE